MANTFTVISGNRGVSFLRSPGLIHLTFTCGASYATASGGLAVDLTTLLSGTNALVGAQPPGITVSDLLGGYGFSTLGWIAVLTPVAATPGTFTMRLWNGITEKSDGAITDVISLFVFTS